MFSGARDEGGTSLRPLSSLPFYSFQPLRALLSSLSRSPGAEWLQRTRSQRHNSVMDPAAYVFLQLHLQHVSLSFGLGYKLAATFLEMIYTQPHLAEATKRHEEAISSHISLYQWWETFQKPPKKFHWAGLLHTTGHPLKPIAGGVEARGYGVSQGKDKGLSGTQPAVNAHSKTRSTQGEQI